MIESLIVTNLGPYFVQVLVIALAAGILLAVFRINVPGVRYVVLRGTLAICIALPWLQSRETAGTGTISTTLVVQSAADPGAALATPAATPVEWSSWIVVALLAGMAMRLVWLAIGLIRLTSLRKAGEPAASAEHSALQTAMGTTADVRYVAGFVQPVTFGFRQPVVLLPESLRAQPEALREAVLAHELVHVQRRDWAWVLVEEAARAVFWFHPAIWWLISSIQLAREEVVDALAVARTGRRRAYVQALMAFEGAGRFPPAPAFARKRHLFRRIVLISREDAMTVRRLVISVTAVVAVMTLGGWYVVRAFPLVAPAASQILQQTPGPLESAAKPVTPENPIPRRLQHAAPEYPADAAAENAWVSVTMRLTLDLSGSVAEARVIDARLRLGDTVTSVNDERAKPAYGAVVNAAVAAVERWRYDAPANAPISFDTTFFFAPNLPVSDTPAVAPRAVGRITDEKALRVGGNVRVPTKLKDVRPVYPPDAKEAGIQGVVIMDIRIDEQGRVDEARVLRSIPALDQAALDAVRQWEFQPTLLNGAPIPVILTVTVQFTLQ